MYVGVILNNELKLLNMNASDFARHIYVPANRITEIIRGNRIITADTALRLENFLGVSAEFWLNLQSKFLLIKEKKLIDNHHDFEGCEIA